MNADTTVHGATHMGRPAKPKTATVRLPVEIADLAHRVAGLKRIDVAELLGPILGPVLKADFAEELRKAQDALQGGEPARPKSKPKA